MENVKNISASCKGNHKLNQAKIWLIKKEVNIACWVELGVPWYKNIYKETLKNLMKCPFWDVQLKVAANNIHGNAENQQYRGTATMAFNYIVSMVLDPVLTAMILVGGLGLEYKVNWM